MISEDIRRQIKGGEQDVLAFVASPTDLNAIAETVCAFLNAQGGVLFVGVEPSGDIVGVGPDAETFRRSIEQTIQLQIAPKALFTASVDVESDLPVISIEAPQGRDGPYSVNGQYFTRSGKRTVSLDPTALNQFLRERSIEAQRWERRPSISFDDDDIASGEVTRMISDAQSTGRYDFSGREDGASVFQRLGLTTAGGYTQAADVLFAKSPEQRHPQCRVRYISYESSKVSDKYLDDRWIAGPLGVVCDTVIERLSAAVRIQATFRSDDHRRQDKPNYSLAALREGIVNALAHRDYAAFSSGVTVSVFPGRIEIWNSGSLPKALSVASLKKVHPSIPTNPDIAYILYLRGLMDRLGRGTQKILLGCKELGARPPRWEAKPTGITLTIYSADGDETEAVVLNDRQARLLDRLRPGDSIKAATYMTDEDVSERQARRDLADLETAGLLEKTGMARATSYRRTEREV